MWDGTETRGQGDVVTRVTWVQRRGGWGAVAEGMIILMNGRGRTSEIDGVVLARVQALRRAHDELRGEPPRQPGQAQERLALPAPLFL